MNLVTNHEFENNPNSYDLILSDMTMPIFTGIQLILKAKKIRPDTKTVICTGFSELISEQKAKALGIDAYLMKPVSFKKLGEIVRKALDE